MGSPAERKQTMTEEFKYSVGDLIVGVGNDFKGAFDSGIETFDSDSKKVEKVKLISRRKYGLLGKPTSSVDRMGVSKKLLIKQARSLWHLNLREAKNLIDVIIPPVVLASLNQVRGPLYLIHTPSSAGTNWEKVWYPEVLLNALETHKHCFYFQNDWRIIRRKETK